MNRLLGPTNRTVDELHSQVRELAARVASLEHERSDGAAPDLAPAHVEGLLQRFRAEAADAARRALELHREARQLPPELYLALENRFRGSSVDVRRGQEVYVADVQGVASNAPVADLGCGRGEFVRLLADHQIEAFGVDDNPSMVDTAAALDVPIQQRPLLDFLETAEPSSLRAITMFHVVEHLELADLFAALGHAHRVLVPGGVFIAETPNISNLAVAASGFWLDPTHVRPLHPELLRFLASAAGFEDVEPRFLHPVKDPPPDGAAGRDALVRQLVTHIYGAQDFAIIARRAA